MGRMLLVLKMIKLTKLSEYQYSVNLSNGKFIGYFEKGDDGFFHWWPGVEKDNGYWSSDLILELGRKLDELNIPYQKDLDVYFESISKTCDSHVENK